MTKMVKAILNGDWEIVVPEEARNKPAWHTEMGWEKIRLRSLHDNIVDGDVLYYVGAEEGEMSALCQIWGAEVVLFEPNPKIWSNMLAMWKANNLKNPLATIPCFASDENNSLIRIYRNEFPPEAYQNIEEAHGFKELYQEGDKYGQVTIDDCYYFYGLKPPTIITLDVEGSETKVLHGAEKVIKEFKPKIWLSGHPEFMFHQYGLYLSDLRNWIKNLGYTETLLDYQHEVHFYYEPN
jgi:FkbM family methyltransferase